MAGNLKIEIIESVETLSKLIKQEKNPQKKERIQALYWIKTNLVESIGHLSSLSGKHRTTVSRWLSSYRKGGLSKMLDIYKSSGRKAVITPEIEQILINELKEKEGFSSYKEIQTWLYTSHNLDVSYKVVHDTVHYRLKAKLKVPRRSNVKKDAQAEAEFKKKFHL
ncbi:MAG: helix-turn-helix domain-containing protein [Xenococcaceae cyanobacterium MO_167.B27]|nr:helix-turn-helix domain-containing protein [Xenococcaceae cyanobacterium MO_167.B27]